MTRDTQSTENDQNPPTWAHTPGPWVLGEESGLIKAGSTNILDDCFLRQADARLIAASPDLLGCCKLALRFFELAHRDQRVEYIAQKEFDEMRQIGETILPTLRAAIAKATEEREAQ